MKFPRDFFQAEERCGFIIPEMMKRAWAAELEVLEVIKEVCDKYGLIYYAGAGTLLGAVRHGGFIPWDDDIDLYMLRADYDRFMIEAKEALPKGFVISGIYGDELRLWKANQAPQGRVIVDETIFTLPDYMNYFHGFPYMRIGIDIFPLDFYPEDIEKQYELVKLCNDLQTVVANWEFFKKHGELQTKISKLEERLDVQFDRTNEDILKHDIMWRSDRLVATVDKSETALVEDVLYCRASDSIRDYKPITGKRLDWFGEGIIVPFENTEIRVPSKPEEVLKSIFGEDYMTPIKFTSEHEYPFYKVQEQAFKKLLKDSGVYTPVDEFCRNWHRMNGGE